MKATDLMIGDLVVYGGLYTKVIYIGRKISLYDGKGTEFTIDPCHIEPIPLTEEILVKYGFKHSMPHNDWTNTNCNFYLYEGGNGYRISNTDIKLDYVHQLQHLLRMCGIEKEIEL